MCKWLRGLYGLNDLHCGDLFLERISIAHNGSKLTCNINHIQVMSQSMPHHKGGQVIKSPPMSYWLSSTLQKRIQVLSLCSPPVCVRGQTMSSKERLQERWSQRVKGKERWRKKRALVHYIRSCINTSHVISVLHYACQEKVELTGIPRKRI